jgi:hypothetical protein
MNWTLGQALSEAFPIHLTVLSFQGIGTKRIGKRQKVSNGGNLSGVSIGAERK